MTEQEKRCGGCGSGSMKPFEFKPPKKHNGPCTSECTQQGFLCLNCRLVR